MISSPFRSNPPTSLLHILLLILKHHFRLLITETDDELRLAGEQHVCMLQNDDVVLSYDSDSKEPPLAAMSPIPSPGTIPQTGIQAADYVRSNFSNISDANNCSQSPSEVSSWSHRPTSLADSHVPDISVDSSWDNDVIDEFHDDPDLINNIDKLLAKHLKPFPEVDVSDVKKAHKKDQALRKMIQLKQIIRPPSMKYCRTQWLRFRQFSSAGQS